MNRLEKWLEKRYGRLLTKAEARATLDLSGIDWKAAWNPPHRFPQGHVREYDPDGIYTYKDQNPRFKENPV